MFSIKKLAYTTFRNNDDEQKKMTTQILQKENEKIRSLEKMKN